MATLNNKKHLQAGAAISNRKFEISKPEQLSARANRLLRRFHLGREDGWLALLAERYAGKLISWNEYVAEVNGYADA